MNCQRFENVASELARGQMMQADVRAEALAHSGQCRTCALRLQDEETLTSGLRALALEAEAMRAPDEIELRLREALRNREALRPAVSSTRGDSRRYWLAAAAAVLLIVSGVIAVRWSASVPQVVTGGEASKNVPVIPGKSAAPGSVEKVNEVVAVDEAPKQDEAPKRNASKPVRKSRVSGPRAPAETLAVNRATNEIATEFMPVGYMNAANLQDGGQIVRVEVPRSTMASFGFPVNMERYNEKVKADVVLGVDGLAHAIRFVQ